MTEKKPDRRTLRTRRNIRDALAVLLCEKELRKVTVQEISDLADVNRVTFYKHYLDVYDLYEKIEKEVLVELGLLILELQELPAREFFEKLIGYIYEDRKIFSMIFSPNSTGNLRDKFAKLIEGLFLQMQKEAHSKLSEQSLIYLSCYRARGCLAVIEKWVNGGFAEDKDFIIDTLALMDDNTEGLL
ncbi:TetR/AcrR family transcriptional regulator [Ruminococcus sp.]|uniref:TetR/AcrR family transcriptional regulator n=1 Tax=Ruminococcus sp. TaxID=41978 RepID=UPI0025D32A02|nr:TetR/AcrR family transcriptional regulator [Ruminococcus sp.]MBQ8965636.1 TetR/AcrR family transcriptional regulator [Ruminococcus sp.]